VGAGAVTVLGQDNGGVDYDFADQRSAPSDVSRVVVDADVGIGHFEVDNDTTLGRNDPFSDEFDPAGELDGVSVNTACRG
jgi:hypothetical protein